MAYETPPPPRSTDKAIYTRFYSTEADKIRRAATESGLTPDMWVQRAVRQALNRAEEKRKQ